MEKSSLILNVETSTNIDNNNINTSLNTNSESNIENNKETNNTESIIKIYRNNKVSNLKQLKNKNEIYKVIFVLGNAGSGKNTQCDIVKEHYNLTHFSCGDLLRAAASLESESDLLNKESTNSPKNNDLLEKSKLINECIKEGKIVPAKITCQLAKDEMDKKGKENVYLIDGFPRNKENLEGWVKVFGEECIILAVLLLDCPDDVCTSRIQYRSKNSGRIDDNLDSLKKRFNVFREETMPNIEYMSQFTNIIKVDGNNNSKEEVFASIKNEFDKLILVD